MRSWQRREVLGALAAGCCAPMPAVAEREAFPQRAISLWVPWPAGGATDLTLRVLAEFASRHLGQKVLTENRAGAGGTLVMPVLLQAAPDGYTVAQMPKVTPLTWMIGVVSRIGSHSTFCVCGARNTGCGICATV